MKRQTGRERERREVNVREKINGRERKLEKIFNGPYKVCLI